LIWYALIGLFRSRAALEAEILVLRHQLNVLRRSCPKRVTLTSMDRLLLVGLYRLAPGVLDALKIIRPATLVCTEKLDSGVLVVKPADQGMRHDAADPLNRARDRRIFAQ
jgi:hypothetical protein